MATVCGAGTGDGAGVLGVAGAAAGAGTAVVVGGVSAARTTRRMNPTSGSAGSNRPFSAVGSGRSGSNDTLRSRSPLPIRTDADEILSRAVDEFFETRFTEQAADYCERLRAGLEEAKAGRPT